ncbi:MAG: PQQ-like beta-propeller repeat protein [Bryobacteraceae bacterium]|nr:PQQ-like beta-propeller repeat protein [Bryobacteraceae bacterium]
MIAVIVSCHAADWPQWRGPQRNGHSPETGLLQSWPRTGPPRVFKAQGAGEGYSSMAVSRGKLITQGQRRDSEFVVAFDSQTGRKLWETPNGKAFRERRGHGPRGTPTIDGDRVFALSADGNLLCLDLQTGKPSWNVNIVQKYGGSIPTWGISESPLVDGDRLIVMPGGRGSAVIALDKRNGNLVWKSQSDSVGYSSAIAVDSPDGRLIIAFTGDGVLGLLASNGELLWRYDKVSNSTANIATPIHSNGYVFVSSDYGAGCALLRLLPGRKMQEVYFSRDMKNHYSSSVLVGSHLYGFNSNILTALEFATGKVAWRDRSVGKGSLIYGDGHLVVLGENGLLALVEANPAAYREKSRFDIQRGDWPAWSPPVIADGKLYLRDQDSIYCWDVKAK